MLGTTQESKHFYFMRYHEKQATTRCGNIQGVRHVIVLSSQEMLHEIMYVQSIKNTLENIRIKAETTPKGEHERRFNAPIVDEVAILIVSKEFEK